MTMSAASARTRVLILVSGSPVAGGAERFCLNLATRIDRAKLDIHVAWVWHFDSVLEREYQDKLQQLGVPHYCCAPYIEAETFRQNTMRGVAGFRALLHQLQPTLINTHTEPADFCMAVARMAALTHRLPWIRTAHNTVEWPWATHVGKAMDLACPVLCDVELAVSNAAVRRLDRRMLARLLRRRARFVANAIDAQAIRTRAQVRPIVPLREALHLSDDVAIFGTAARMTEQKGIRYLLDSFVAVRSRLSEAHLVIAGDGELLADLKQYAVDLGLAEVVHFLGQRQDVLYVISAFDVFVLPSLWEGLPTVVLEAMTLDIPVVATDIPGTDELITHEQTGLLVAPRDAAALANGMVRMFSDRALAQQCIQASHTIVERYSIEPVTHEYERLFRAHSV